MTKLVSTLLYCTGPEAEGVIASTMIQDEKVHARPDQVWRVSARERAKFSCQNRWENKSIEEYLTVLYAPVKF